MTANFASSAGWKDRPKSRIQRRAPFTRTPTWGTRTRRRSRRLPRKKIGVSRWNVLRSRPTAHAMARSPTSAYTNCFFKKKAGSPNRS
jgi:hypothetical protein